MVKIKLHGILDVLDKPMVISAATVREASEAVIAHLRRVKPELFTKRLFFQIHGHNNPEDLDKPLEVKELHFMPAFSAGKKAGIFQVIIGAVLIVAGVLTLGSAWGIPLILTGAGMALGGVVQLLTPVPRIDTVPEPTNPEASKYLAGTGNTTKSGTRIPLTWGTFPVYGQFLSINVQSRDVSTSTYSGGTPVDPYDPDYRYGYGVGTGGSIYAY